MYLIKIIAFLDIEIKKRIPIKKINYFYIGLLYIYMYALYIVYNLYSEIWYK